MPIERFPDFFAAVPRLAVRDPLAEFLGAAEGGVLEYGYADAVRLALSLIHISEPTRPY